MPFTATCVPGPNAGAAVQILGRIQHQPAVVVFLDPDRVVIAPPRNRDEWPGFLAFLRDIRDTLDNLADHLDPQNESEYYERLFVAPANLDTAKP
jgi:hypothetical protein